MYYLYSISDIIEWESFIFLLEGFLLFYLASLVKDKLHPSFKLSEELVLKDNVAMALSMVGYWASITIVLASVIASPTTGRLGQDSGLHPIVSDMLETLFWGVFAIIVLNLVFFMNDKIFLSRFSNLKEIIEDRNVGVGAVLMGAYISSALIIRALILSPALEYAYLDILFFVFYFIAGQAALLLFLKLYISMAGYDVMAELEADNHACGVALGLSLIAAGYIISYPMQQTFHFIVIAAYFVNGTVFLVITRFLTDKLILRKADLCDEIAKDRNMGAALIEGALAVAIAFLITSSFSL